MVVAVLYAGLALVLVVVGISGLYEQRLYTPEQREGAQQLFRLRGLLWLSTTSAGVVMLALVATGETQIIIDYTFSIALLGLVLVFVERQFHRAVDVDQSPLVEQFENWWRHPSDR